MASEKIEKLNMVGAINQALAEEMAADSSVVILGEDVGADGGVFRVTQGLLEKFGPERVIDTPLAELAIVGSAVGMSLYGLKPVAEIQFMGFIYEALEQVFSHACRMRSRSRGRFSCPLVIRTPYGIGIKAPELHSESTEAIFTHFPGLKVVVPSNPYNAKGLLKAAIRDPDPVIFLEPSRLYRAIRTEVPTDDYTVELGRASVIQEGKALTVVAWGAMVKTASEAAEGYDAEIIDLMTLKPYDEDAILKSVKKTGRLVIAEEASRICAFGAEISAFVSERAFGHISAPVIRVSAPDAVTPMARLEEHFRPSVERIKKAFDAVLSY